MTDRSTRDTQKSNDDEASRKADRMLEAGSNTSPGGVSGVSGLDLLRGFPANRFPTADNQRPATDYLRPAVPRNIDQGNAPTDRQRVTDQYAGLVKDGVLQVRYGEADFDAKLSLTNYHTLKISGLPKEMRPSPWIDDQGNGNGKGYFFWFRHNSDESDRNLSDRTRHYFPPNVKKVEIERMVGNVYKPEVIIADEMRISATQSFMKKQNSTGFASYGNATDVFKYAERMSQIGGTALNYQEELMRDGAKSSPDNPYFRIYLADVLAAQAIKPVIEAFSKGEKVYFDNPQTLAKLDEAIKETRIALEITRKYGDRMRPPAYETPLTPFGLNPYHYNPDMYWGGASYQAAQREVQLTLLRKLATTAKLPIELPPAQGPLRHLVPGFNR